MNDQQKENLIRILSKGIRSIETLMAESGGVYGLHLNGAMASWNDLLTGGRYEDWLHELNVAVRTLDEVESGNLEELNK